MRHDGRQPDDLRPITFERDYTDAPGGLGAGELRAHPGAVHGLDRRGRAPLDAGQGQGLGHRRVLDAARLVARAHPPRGEGRQAVGPHPGDPAAHRPVAARGVRHGAARRASGHRRLRRAAGRRRHPHGVDLRWLPGAARRAHPPGAGQAHRQPPAHRLLRRDLGGHHRRRAAARPALRRGLARRGRHERGHDRGGPLRRGAGHGRGRAVQPRRARRPAGPGRVGHRPASSTCSARSSLVPPEPRPS